MRSLVEQQYKEQPKTRHRLKVVVMIAAVVVIVSVCAIANTAGHRHEISAVVVEGLRNTENAYLCYGSVDSGEHYQFVMKTTGPVTEYDVISAIAVASGTVKEFKTFLKILSTILEVCILLEAGKERQS